jgi:hypothetical protein
MQTDGRFATAADRQGVRRQQLMIESHNPKEEVLNACARALSFAPAEYPADLPTREGLFGAPEWYSFECKAWEIGENIRHQLMGKPKVKANTALLGRIISVIQCRNLRRGRQSFVLLIGFKGASGYADEIARLLSDPDVNGHALDTLLKMRVAGYASKVEALLESEHTWIRKKAKTYLERYPRAASLIYERAPLRW